MSGTGVKQEEASTLPAKSLVSSENESLQRQNEETRGDSAVTKREEGTEDRERSSFSQNSSSSSINKSSKSSPSARNNNINNSSNNVNPKKGGGAARYNPHTNMPVGPRGPFPMGYGAPPPYGYPGGNYGPPPPRYGPPPHHPHMMPHQYANGPGGPYPGGPPPGMKGNYHPPMPYGGGPYGMPSYPPPHHGMNPNFPPHSNNNNNASSSMVNIAAPSGNDSISSKSSMNSKKKRTIDGMNVAGSNSNGVPSAYTFRRSDSNTSSSTVTAGNNTSAETVDSHQNQQHPLLQQHSSTYGGRGGPPQPPPPGGQQQQSSKPSYHRRDYSGASTASSLSVGGFSLSSYERVSGALDDAMMTTDNHKRHKKNNLVVDTGLRPPSSLLQPLDNSSTRFEQLSIDAKPPTSTDSGSSAGNSNIFLSMSTSPINPDVDATPNIKNTGKSSDGKSESIKSPIEKDRPSDTPTPPVHGELGDSEMMNDDHSMLNRHLRGQSFTPLPHISNGGDAAGTSPSNAAFASAIAPQLSWSIAGDTPSLGDLAEWDADMAASAKLKTDQKSRPNSTTSTDTRNMMISPHDFQLWKEEHELVDQTADGTTTPLPVFFEQSGNEGAENQMRFENNKERGGGGGMQQQGRGRPHEQPDHMQMYNGGSKKHEHPFWMKHDGSGGSMGMPPTPMYQPSEYRDDGFSGHGHSPMHAVDRRDGAPGGMGDYGNFPPYHHHHPGNERIRNLRGRMPPGAHFPPMPLHIPPHISSHHLPMTSPMGLGPGKGMWSPHHGMGLGSPHHMGSPLNNMAQSKRKCVPLKPPIPSKFQGDMEKVKTAPVPEFTSLVNFPSHMSQKQSVNLPEGMRCCVMCGNACPCSTGTKGKKCNGGKGGKPGDGGLAPRSSNGQDHLGDKSSGYAIIPTQNKGLCTLCDVNVWVVANSGLEIKWCKGCKNFRPWAAFGDKGLATKCLRCRERQREKYALQKEEKEKARLVAKTTTSSVAIKKE